MFRAPVIPMLFQPEVYRAGYARPTLLDSKRADRPSSCLNLRGRATPVQSEGHILLRVNALQSCAGYAELGIAGTMPTPGLCRVEV